MKIVSLVCPQCNSNLDIEEGRKECYCQYCGAHIVVDDETKKNVHQISYRNEAKIKAAEVRIKELEQQLEMEKLRQQQENTPSFRKTLRSILIAVTCLTAIICISGAFGVDIPSNVITMSMAICIVTFLYLVITGIISGLKNLFR